MNPAPQPTWAEANQQSLMTALARVRLALETWAARAAPDAVPQASPPASSGGVSPPEPSDGPRTQRLPFALESVCAAFNLSPFERDLLLLCAGPDLEAKFAPLLAQAHGDPRRTAPTFSLALAALPDAHWSALLPTAPLRRWRLVEVGTGDSLTSSPLRIDEWLLHFLAGTPHLDERLQALVRPVAATAPLTPSQHALVGRVTRLCQTSPTGRALPLIQLCGDSPDDQLAVAGHACAALGCRLHRLAAHDAPTTSIERETFARLWEREAALGGSALLVDFRDAESPDAARAALALLETVNGLVFVLTREPLRGLTRATWKLDVPRPAPREQHDLWLAALGPRAAELNGHLEAVTGQFCLTAQEIREAADSWRTEAALSQNPDRGSRVTTAASDSASCSQPPATPAGSRRREEADSVASDAIRLLTSSATVQGVAPGPAASTLWSHCRTRSCARLESLAQRLEPAATWNDLVLPEAQSRTLREIATHVRHRFRVHEQWGFAARGARGLGISALFAGASGTGKTMAAEVLANELQLDLFRIDLSAVVSKYIGETEKNLRRVFDAAEAGGAILLFDEADALFGKRSEVKDSHDRYANIEVGYLLQRIETYRGLAVLTTNFKQALDPAFLRRLRFVVQFPFPDAAQRTEIWRRVFPAATPTDALAPGQLARLNVAGGNIRNIALHAAFLAADTGEPVRMKHLLQAARGECAKLERPPSEAELGGWV